MTDRKHVEDFYDQFTGYELKTGINLRHYTIFNQVIKSGLKRNHKVLEIGCGIGQVTGLLHGYLTKGKIVSTDISPESIAIARKRIGPSTRLEFVVTDMTDFINDALFDFIILPDVLEHIPIENHDRLFGLLDKLMHDQSVILIHIPHPKVIEHDQKHQPSNLQIIDQPLRADDLLNNAYRHQLTLVKYNPYRLFHHQLDYIFITFIRDKEISFIPYPKGRIIYKKLLARFRYYMSKLN